MLKVFYDRLSHLYRKYGVIRLARVIGNRPWRKLFHGTEYLFVINCDDEIKSRGSELEEYEVKLYLAIDKVPEKDLEVWSKHRGSMDSVRSVLQNFFAKEGILEIFSKQGAMIGYGWAVRKGINGFHFFPLLENEAVLYAAEIFPEFRGKGMMSILMNLTVGGLAQMGIERVYVSCEAWNHASYRGISKTSAIELGRAREFRLGNRTIVVWRDVVGSTHTKRGKDLQEAN